MHDVGAQIAQDVDQLHQRERVMKGSDRTFQRSQRLDRNRRRQQIPHVAFAAIELAVNEERFESARRQSFGQRDRLNRRPADVQPRDDSKDAHRENCTTTHVPVDGTSVHRW
jgi:hypothetical protein